MENDMQAPERHPALDQTGRYEKVAEVYCGGYSWGIAAVWRDKATGKLYGDTDSGCSCYGEWDEGEFPGEFVLGRCKQITHQREAGELLDNVSGEDGDPSTTERQDFVRAVAVALAQ